MKPQNKRLQVRLNLKKLRAESSSGTGQDLRKTQPGGSVDKSPANVDCNRLQVVLRVEKSRMSRACSPVKKDLSS